MSRCYDEPYKSIHVRVIRCHLNQEWFEFDGMKFESEGEIIDHLVAERNSAKKLLSSDEWAAEVEREVLDAEHPGWDIPTK